MLREFQKEIEKLKKMLENDDEDNGGDSGDSESEGEPKHKGKKHKRRGQFHPFISNKVIYIIIFVF